MIESKNFSGQSTISELLKLINYAQYHKWTLEIACFFDALTRKYNLQKWIILKKRFTFRTNYYIGNIQLSIMKEV